MTTGHTVPAHVQGPLPSPRVCGDHRSMGLPIDPARALLPLVTGPMAAGHRGPGHCASTRSHSGRQPGCTAPSETLGGPRSPARAGGRADPGGDGYFRWLGGVSPNLLYVVTRASCADLGSIFHVWPRVASIAPSASPSILTSKHCLRTIQI